MSAGPRALGRRVVQTFAEEHLLIAAGGIALRTFLALVTGLLFVIALAGILGLEDLWREDFAPDVRGAVSPATYRVIDQAVSSVLEERAVFWATLGLGVALWQISGAVRATGQTLNRVYDAPEERTLPRELASSVAAAAAIGALVLGAVAAVQVGPLLLDDLLGEGWLAEIASFLVRWALAAVLLFVAVGLLTKLATGERVGWVSSGSRLVVAGWVVTTLAFGLYLTYVADLGNVYWILISAYAFAEYLFVLAVVLLAGLLLDHLASEEEG